MKARALWVDHELVPEKTTIWQCGDFSLYLRQEGADLLLAPFYQEEEVDVHAWTRHRTLPEDLEWRRWAVKSKQIRFHIRPCLPDRPLVVHARRPFILPPGEKALFYVHIPMYMRVFCRDMSSTKEGYRRLDTFPSMILSETWFGDKISGCFCYALQSRARRILEDFPLKPNKALCPVRVYNRSKVPLEYHKICLRTQYLSTYCTEESLWTNQVNVRYLGSDQESELKYEGRPPKQAETPKLLTAAIHRVDDNFFSRTFINPFKWEDF